METSVATLVGQPRTKVRRFGVVEFVPTGVQVSVAAMLAASIVNPALANAITFRVGTNGSYLLSTL
ncbi:hypothetical protein [Pandoraea pulmonicola]|nr:hypothetical protein [Pandoraea pulmonicola]AJC20725.1 hypothetical protein RO07_10045 [Pandoraea pulmonicola]